MCRDTSAQSSSTLARLETHIFKEKTMNRISCLTLTLAALLLFCALPATAGGGDVKKDRAYVLINKTNYHTVLSGKDHGYPFNICRATATESCVSQDPRDYTHFFVKYEVSHGSDVTACTFENLDLKSSLTITISPDLKCKYSIR